VLKLKKYTSFRIITESEAINVKRNPGYCDVNLNLSGFEQFDPIKQDFKLSNPTGFNRKYSIDTAQTVLC